VVFEKCRLQTVNKTWGSLRGQCFRFEQEQERKAGEDLYILESSESDALTLCFLYSKGKNRFRNGEEIVVQCARLRSLKEELFERKLGSLEAP
jgi:hypothetical protein